MYELKPLRVKKLSARDAWAGSGQSLDAAQHGPVTISKHGGEVAVTVSKQDFDALQALKLEHLRAEIQQALADIAESIYSSAESSHVFYCCEDDGALGILRILHGRLEPHGRVE